LTLLAKADECGTKAEAYKVLLEQSLRNIPVSLFFLSKVFISKGVSESQF
jgi:hypothetical protein